MYLCYTARLGVDINDIAGRIAHVLRSVSTRSSVCAFAYMSGRLASTAAVDRFLQRSLSADHYHGIRALEPCVVQTNEDGRGVKVRVAKLPAALASVLAI
jgi:hypothetical protein